MWSVCCDHRHHLDAGEAGLPAALVVERADPDQPVGARLDAQRAVRVRHLDREGGGLEAGLLRVRRLVDLGRVAVPLGPAQVHPHQHLGEVGRVHAAGAGPDGHHGLAGVVLAGEEGADLHLLDRLGQRRRARRPPRRSDASSPSASAISSSRLGVVEPGPQPLHPGDLTGQVRQAGVDLLGARLVVPQVGGGGLLLELRLVPAQLVHVEDVLDVAQGGVEGLELFREVGCTHNGQDYAARPVSRPGGSRSRSADYSAGATLSQFRAALW